VHQTVFERACAYSGIACVALFFAAFFFAHFIPPLSPSLSVDEVAAHYREHANGIRVGGILMMLSSLFYCAFVAVIAAQMRKIPSAPPAATYAQLAAGAFACLTFFLPGLLFIVTAFRPEREPAITYALNDMAWIWLVIAWPPFLTQYWSFAYAILNDRSATPRFPRWLGYVNIWAVFCFMPAALLPFFKDGPFAWNGLIVFWVPAIVFIAWFIANTAMMLKAVGHEPDRTVASGTTLSTEP